MYQQIAWYTTVFLVFLLLLAFSFVYGESKRLKNFGPIQAKGYQIRKYYFLSLVAVMGFATAISLSRLPYHQPHQASAEHGRTINVTASQYAWEFSDETFEVGEPVNFIVTSKDVTHGFGLYNPDLDLLAQTQAMPGYKNTVHITFSKPGTYQVLCLEYCSVGHHVMMKEIVVEPKGGSDNEN